MNYPEIDLDDIECVSVVLMFFSSLSLFDYYVLVHDNWRRILRLVSEWLNFDWLIDWIEFNTVSAIFQPFKGGDYYFNVSSLKNFKFPWRPSRAYSASKSSETVFCVPRRLLSLTRGTIYFDLQIQTQQQILIKTMTCQK